MPHVQRNVLPLMLPGMTLLVAILLCYQRYVQEPAALLQLPLAARVERPQPVAPAAASTPASAAPAPYVIPLAQQALAQNGDFAQGLKGWDYWQHACSATTEIQLAQVAMQPAQWALQIQNPLKQLTGVRQLVSLVSGTVYRLSARARSCATTDSKVVFGGRVAIFLPPQPEQALLWMSESTDWWAKALVFTNQVSGAATLFVHLGYGGVASTGEFANITLDELCP